MSERDDTGRTPWRAPTRRAFVGMIAAAAAAALAPKVEPSPAVASRSRSGTTFWIGHC